MPLFILKQTSLSEDVIIDDGVSKVIHTVVKNSPFIVLIGQRPDSSDASSAPSAKFISFNNYAVNCILLYDTSENKPVDFIKNEPICFKPSVLNNGAALQVEAKLKVLTSKHEDMHFKILIKLLPLNPAAGPQLEVVSRPIKVISKPEQVKKKRKASSAEVEDTLAPLQKNPRVKVNVLPDGVALPLPQAQEGFKSPIVSAATAATISTAATTAPTAQKKLQQSITPGQAGMTTVPAAAAATTTTVNAAGKQQHQMMGCQQGYNSSQPPPPQPQPQQQQQQQQQSAQMYSSLEDLTSSYAITKALDNNIIESLQRIESKETSYLGFIEEVCSFVYNVVGCSGVIPSQQQQQQQQQQFPSEVSLSSTSLGAPGNDVPGQAAAATAATEQNSYYQGNLNNYESDRTVSCLLDSFGRLSQAERAGQVRRVMNVLSAEQKSNMAEMIELFFSEGLESTRNERFRPSGFDGSNGSNSSSGGSSNYFVQQQQSQQYYNDPSDLSNIWM